MNTRSSHPSETSASGKDSGQAAVLLLLMLSTFMLAMLAFAVDLTEIWFHRQSAQSAADAACLAGAADMLAVHNGAKPPGLGFTAGVGSDCATSSAAPLCKYAKFNGYDGAGLKSNAVSNSVTWSFPSSVAGAVTPTGPKAPLFPFLQVDVVENVQTYFMGLVGKKYQQVAASSSCGESGTLSAAPMLILDPTASGALTLPSAGSIVIKGGPPRSIQVNSTSTTAISSGTVDTTGAGPNLTGADVAVASAETIPSGFNLGTGNWVPNAIPYPDPLSTTPAPTIPLGTTPAVQSVPYQQDGCPNSGGCQEYSPGTYPTGISLSGTAIFKPGIYILDGDFAMGSNSTVRNAYVGQKQAVLTTDGVMFYMRTGAVTIKGNAGIAVTDSVSPTLMSCDGIVPTGVPATPLNGSILNAQCVDDGTYSGSGGTGNLSSSGSRGLLFFEAHTNTSNPSYSAQGGGALALSGTEYFHTLTNTGIMHYGGNPSGATYLVGYILIDSINMNGTPSLSMVLSQKKLFYTLKVGLFK